MRPSVVFLSFTCYFVNAVNGTNIGGSNNFCVDIAVPRNGGLQNGQPLQLWNCAPSYNQNFQISQNLLKVGNEGSFCVDLPNGHAYNGARLQIWNCAPTNPNQHWTYTNKGEWKWTPNNRDSNYCVDVKDWWYSNGSPLQLWSCSGNQNQVFSYGGQIGPAASRQGLSNQSNNNNGVNPFSQVFPNKRLLVWGVSNEHFPKMINGPKIGGLFHWQDGNIPGNNKPWLIQFWGDRKWAQWNQRKAEIGNWVPPVVLSFNEPDSCAHLEASACMDPYKSAHIHKKEIQDVFRPRGSRIIGPQLAWDLEWMAKFKGECDRIGCQLDGLGLHHYEDMSKGVDTAVQKTIDTVERAYERFKLPIFLTELGFQSRGGGTQQQYIEYSKKIGRYLDNTTKVVVWGLTAVQRRGGGGYGNDGGYMNDQFSFFDENWRLTDLAYSYMYDTY